MEWFEPKKSGGTCKPEPDAPAILVSFGRRNGEIERVRIRLSAEFVKQARLQSGDRLQAGIGSEGQLCLRRHPSGNAISGVGVSAGNSASNTGRPHVTFQSSSYPKVAEWAADFGDGVWVYATDQGSHFVVE